MNILWPIIAVVIIWFLDEASSDISNFVRKKQSLKLETFMYGLLHSKAIRLDLINFERPEYLTSLPGRQERRRGGPTAYLTTWSLFSGGSFPLF